MPPEAPTTLLGSNALPVPWMESAMAQPKPERTMRDKYRLRNSLRPYFDSISRPNIQSTTMLMMI